MPDEKPPNYSGNTSKDREKPKDGTASRRPEAVAKPVVIKKNIGRRIIESFTGDDVQSVGSYLLFEVFIPAAKQMIIDATTQGIERVLMGESRPRTSRIGYTNYNSLSSRSRSGHPETRSISPRGKSTHNFKEIVLETRSEAQDVLDGLVDYLDQFDFAPVSTLYDLVGITGSFTDDQWGWSNLRDASIRPNRGGGYVLDLPKTESID